MSDEKHAYGVGHEDVVEKPSSIAAVKVVIGDESFQQAMIKEPPKAFNTIAVQLYLISLVGFFCSTSNGFDSSLFGNLLANKAFKAFFDVRNVGIWAGIVTSMSQIGGVVALPFIGPAIDTWGRRVGMMFGGGIIVFGVILQGTCVASHSIGQFMAGRFFMGMGVSMIASAGPCYVVEISHPAYRGIVTALYNVFWPVGAIVASGASRGAITMKGNVSWLVPVWLQLMFPAFVVVFGLFLPESPRWLYTRGRTVEAKAILTKYHGNGNPESEWVKLQMMEYETHLELDGADKRWWDYRALFKNNASRYRLMCNCLVALFGQWAGNGVVSYFLSGVLDTAGVTDEIKQSNLFVAMNAVQITISAIGCCFVDKIGRRPMLIWVNIGCCICWIGVSVATSIQHRTGSNASSIATVAMIYIFQAVYSFGWTPLQALLPVEVLSFEMRAKGMAFSSLFTAVGTLVNQFGFPVSLDNIKWKTYLVFTVWCAVQAVILYFLVPETKNRTLEELDDIFNSKSPRKASLIKKKLELDHNANIVHIEPVTGADATHTAA
ncbi:lactose permease [Phlyctema vagabunda]|uniref:Lactose permease n=1 Tax=Phlyctema vagabunda TaxID=108571 RepID=A0ABR4PKM2_9HELO